MWSIWVTLGVMIGIGITGAVVVFYILAQDDRGNV